ncbi:MAG: chemotaxis protein CheW, partial [Calditrichales bacterium]|nr:chemotaxis protein CheW [Calditrichales bacterium]
IEQDLLSKEELVSFKLGVEEFATPIRWVREIIRYLQITTVPNTPDFVEGVINLRGRVIPVIDLRKRLNLPTKKEEKQTRILNIEIDNKLVGFIVDEVTGVITIPSNIIEKTPDIIVAGVESVYITGVCKLEGKLLILLDFDRVLHVSEKDKLKKITDK